MKHAARGPGLRHIGAEILNRKSTGLSLDAGVELRKAMEHEVAGRGADAAGTHGRFFVEPITLETHRDDAVVMRPHGAILIRERVVSRVRRREGADAPAAPHVRFEQAPHHALGPVRRAMPPRADDRRSRRWS